MTASTIQPHHLKGTLNIFVEATGQKVNFSNSVMVPTNIPKDKLENLS